MYVKLSMTLREHCSQCHIAVLTIWALYLWNEMGGYYLLFLLLAALSKQS